MVYVRIIVVCVCVCVCVYVCMYVCMIRGSQSLSLIIEIGYMI